jgi:hypothetical protein
LYLEPARREIERTLLQRFFPSFSLSSDVARGVLKTNSGRPYKIVLDLNVFPLSYPSIRVVYPFLTDHSGDIMGEHGTSARMHHLGTNHRGALQLCLHKPGHHDPRDTLYKSVLKARLWLEAYESHLRTGENIDSLLSHA